MNESPPAQCLLSIVVPVLNEAEGIEAFLQPLQRLREQRCEIIVVDGGSSDATVGLLGPLVDTILLSSPGRAVQINTGAALAKGEVVLFLHADTSLPDISGFLNIIVTSPPRWGFFTVALSGTGLLLRCVERLMNIRSRLTSVATGDQALFVERKELVALGGIPDIPLMEDVAFAKLMRQRAKPLILSPGVLTSSRRWQQRGVIKTILVMWLLRLAYFLKCSPVLLHRIYYR